MFWIDKVTIKYLSIGLIILLISFLGFLFGIINEVMFWVVVIGALYGSCKNLSFGLFVALAEVLLGSQGYLFYMFIDGYKVSLRLGIFLAVFVAFAYRIIRERKIDFFSYRYRYEYYAISGVILYGGLNALWREVPMRNIFLDMNGYLYYGYILIYVQALKPYVYGAHREFGIFLKNAYRLCLACLLTVALHSLFLLYVFSHSIMTWMKPLYIWTRDHRIGEIARPFPSNDFHRIFMQHQIYQVISFISLMPQILLKGRLRKNIWLEVCVAVFAGAVGVLSFSRSFWVGLIIGCGAIGLFLIYEIRSYYKKYIPAILRFVGILSMSLLLVWGWMNFPYPATRYIETGELLKERFNISSEAAVSSRWNLLPVLIDKIKMRLIFGYGFGESVTYQARDPRIMTVNNPDGWYTTYSFEWGYLDMMIKFGAVGFFIYMIMLSCLMINLYTLMNRFILQKNKRRIVFGFLSGLITLIVIHTFTPYLNHPLGIMYLLMIQAVSDYLFFDLEQKKEMDSKRVYVKRLPDGL